MVNRRQDVDDLKEAEIRPQSVDDFDVVFYIPWGHQRKYAYNWGN